MNKFVATLSVVFALVICFCLLPSPVNAESKNAVSDVTIEELELVLSGTSEVGGEISPERYDIDENGIVEYIDLVALRYELGVGDPIVDNLTFGVGVDLLSNADLSTQQSAVVRGDSARGVKLDATNGAASAVLMFDSSFDFSQNVYLHIDTLSTSGLGAFTVVFHTASGDLDPVTITLDKISWNTVSVNLAALPETSLSQVTGLTLQAESGSLIYFDNFYVSGTAQRVQVTFDDTQEVRTFAAGYPYGTLPTPVKEGYIFGGWYTNNGCTGDKVTADTVVPAEALTLYASWIKNITIDFSTVGQRISLSDEEQIWKSSGLIVTNEQRSSTTKVVGNVNPVRMYKSSGVIIACDNMVELAIVSDGGKDYKSALTETLEAAGVDYTVDGDTYTVHFSDRVNSLEFASLAAQIRLLSITATVYVQDGIEEPDTTVRYDVTFDLNYDNAPEAPAKQQVEEGGSYGALPVVDRDGYIFGGWYTDSKCTGDAVAADTKVAASHTLYAKWTAIVDAGQTKDITIDFSTTTHRVMWDATVQVWANDGVTLTNNKASSTNDVIDSSAPVRLYAHSSATITANGISKIVFNANTSGHATALANSIAADPNIGVSTNSKVVTVIFAEAVDSFEIADFSAQVRLDSLVVTAADSGDVVVPPTTEPPATEPTPDPTPEPTDPPAEIETVDRTITFDNTSKRTEFSTTKQVWVEDGITVTNNKTSDSSNVGDYSNPIRFYKNSEVIVECKGMTKIVVTANNSSYADTLASALSTTAVGSTVTITFDTPTDSYTIIPSTGAVWIKSITVTAVVSDGEDDSTTDTVCELVFDLNYAGATDTLETIEVVKGAACSELPPATRDGYTFAGWYLNAEGEGEEVTETTIINDSHILYAKWTAESAPTPDPTPDETDPPATIEKVVTIDFTSDAQRLSQSSTEQTWQNDIVTLVNSKTSSSSNVVGDVNPVKFYANSIVEIQCTGMIKLVFVSNTTTKYITALEDSLNTVDGVSVSKSSNVITVTFAEPKDSVIINSMTAQARVMSMTVTAQVVASDDNSGAGEDTGSSDDSDSTEDSGVTQDPSSVQYTYGNPTGTSYNNVIMNWGVRGDVATALSPRATAFYTGEYTYANLFSKTGSNSLSTVPQSDLYVALNALMVSKHSKKTTYDDVRYLMGYTDCERADSSNLSLLYCGETISSEWDGGVSFNREHCWPKSKTSGSTGTTTVDADIMTLRPATASNNSSRGDKAFGTSTTADYFNPNHFLGDNIDIRGDMARTLLYTFVRWGETNLTGVGGTIESVEVLLTWIEVDPVDTWELGRNDSVESITGTRNVFVDFPELAFILFGEEVPADMRTPSNVA